MPDSFNPLGFSKGRVISKGTFNSVPSLKKRTKSLSLVFPTQRRDSDLFFLDGTILKVPSKITPSLKDIQDRYFTQMKMKALFTKQLWPPKL